MSTSEHDNPDLLTAFVDGELPEADARRVAKRIEGDPNVRRRVAAQRAIKRAVRMHMSRRAAPAQLEQRVRATLFEGTASRDAEPKSARISVRWLLTRSPAFASAVGAVALGIALTVVLTLYSGHRVTPFIRDVYAHHTDVDRFPVRIEGDYKSVANEIANAVGFPVPVPRFDDTFALLGARKCRLCGHLMVFIKYRGDEGLISFFIIPKTRPAIWRLDKHARDEMAFYAADYEGLRMAFWRENDVTYCLAASVGEDRLIDLACEACRQVHDEDGSAVAGRSHNWLPAIASVAH